MAEVPWPRFPYVAAHDPAHRWLQFTANLGRARNTVEAYGRAVEDHLRFCGSVGADPLTLRPDVIADWVSDLHARPNRCGLQVRHLASRAGLSQATIQLRISAVRSFYEYLVEDGLRDRNPVRRGESGRRGRPPKRGLVGRVE
jgi:integrase/recombinase XerD